MSRPERYKENNSNRDWIDEFEATSTAEETRGAFRFTIGKYLRRYGKKDDPLQEALKIQDYANRLVEFEQAALLSTAMSADFGQQHTISVNHAALVEVSPDPSCKVIEPAAAIDDESPRMQAIGQNGNGGEHYDAEKLERWKGAPNDATHWRPACQNYKSGWLKVDDGKWFVMLDDCKDDEWSLLLDDDYLQAIEARP